MSDNDKTVTIPLEEYAFLEGSLLFLDCLVSVGVKEWEGYNEARILFVTAMDDCMDACESAIDNYREEIKT